MFELIYLTRHSFCGQLIQLSDYRIKSRVDLKQKIELLKLHCPKCWLEINATHFEVWGSERLGLKRIVDEMSIENLKDIYLKLN
jgi:hypothetical protein